jgi:nucleotidyltransferase/DNA polymerase involved in DNA repair
MLRREALQALTAGPKARHPPRPLASTNLTVTVLIVLHPATISVPSDRCIDALRLPLTLKRRHLAAHTIQVKVRYGDFTTLTRQLTVEEPISEARDIYRLGCFLLGREQLVRRPLRLLGLGVSSLREPTAQQLILL